MEIRYYNHGLQDFVASLNERTQAKFLEVTDFLSRHNYRVGMPLSRQLGGHLYELRIRSAEEVRIFYTFHQSAILLLHGFIKQEQKTPRREIRIAKRRLKDLDTA